MEILLCLHVAGLPREQTSMLITACVQLQLQLIIQLMQLFRGQGNPKIAVSKALLTEDLVLYRRSSA